MTSDVAAPALPRRHWIYRFAQVGFASKGAVYFLVGWLGIRAGLGLREATVDPQGALGTVEHLPLGKLFLPMLALGLFGHAMWRIAEAIRDPDGRAHGFNGVIRRVTCTASGIGYGALGWSAFRIASKVKPVSQDGLMGELSRRLMTFPDGRGLVAAVGAGFLIAGIADGLQGFTGRFRQKLDLARWARPLQIFAVTVARIGLFSRMALFATVGVLFEMSAFHHDPSEAKGPNGAFEVLQRHTWGAVVVCLLGLGLIAYAGLMFLISLSPRHPATPEVPGPEITDLSP